MRLAPPRPARPRVEILEPDFEEDRYSWRERQAMAEREQQGSWASRHIAWIRRQPWPLQLIIVVAWLGAIYLAGIFGMFLGLFIRAV